MLARLRTAAVLLGVVCAASCTALDDDPWDKYIAGTPFTFDDPQGAVTLLGELQDDPSPGGEHTCPAGTTFYWGEARNTGDVDVEGVKAVIEVFDAGGRSLGQFRGNVYLGEVTTTGTLETSSTNLAVDESGSFLVCTSVPWGGAARAEFSAEFDVVETEEP